MSIAYNEKMREPAKAAIIEAAMTESLWVSAISAWELGLIATRTGRTGPRVGDARTFFAAAVERAKLRVRPLNADVLLEAAYLPEPFHRDPSDRMIVSEARIGNLLLVTSDRHILDYAALGHVRAIRA